MSPPIPESSAVHRGVNYPDTPLGPWLKAAVDGVVEVMPMLGLDRCEVLGFWDSTPGAEGCFVTLEGVEHAYMIGFMGSSDFLVELSMALGMFAFEDLIEDPSLVRDAVGEFANILAGRVKLRFDSPKDELETGLPFFVTGDFRAQGEIARGAVGVRLGDWTLHLVVRRHKLPPNAVKKRRTNAEQKARDAHLHAIWQAAPEGILALDGAGTITSANPKAEDIFGRVTGELDGVNIRELIPRWEQEVPAPSAMDEGSPPIESQAITGLHANSASLPLEVSVARCRRHDDSMQVVVVRDVTARE